MDSLLEVVLMQVAAKACRLDTKERQIDLWQQSKSYSW